MHYGTAKSLNEDKGTFAKAQRTDLMVKILCFCSYGVIFSIALLQASLPPPKPDLSLIGFIFLAERRDDALLLGFFSGLLRYSLGFNLPLWDWGAFPFLGYLIPKFKFANLAYISIASICLERSLPGILYTVALASILAVALRHIPKIERKKRIITHHEAKAPSRHSELILRRLVRRAHF